MKQISTNAPSLGGVLTLSKIVPTIGVAVTDRPYIIGSAVCATTAGDTRDPVKCVIGNTNGKVAGIMCLGVPQIYQYGKFVKQNEAPNNNIALKGAFYCALDLSNFVVADVQALTDNGVLSIDGNGVFSYSNAVVSTEGTGTAANTIAVTNNNIVVLNYFATPVIEAFEETISVGGQSYTYKYPSGIGIIALSI